MQSVVACVSCLILVKFKDVVSTMTENYSICTAAFKQRLDQWME